MAKEVSGLRRKPTFIAGSESGTTAPQPAASPALRKSPVPTAPRSPSSPGLRRSPVPTAPRPPSSPGLRKSPVPSALRAPGRAPAPSDDPVDSFDVPAAVLCAFCGQADCPGCLAANENESGVIAIVPWERPGAMWTRLWATANASTQGAEAFFAVLPDGEIPPAMRFAVLAELLAVASMVAILAPIVAIAFPPLAAEIIQNPSLRASALRWIGLGIPALALWMVAAHITHGAALDAGARRQGALPQRRRAVRFGLYACGWDLMAGPLGAVVVLASKGMRDALSLVDIAMRVPGKATTALLQGVYKLPPDGVAGARRVGVIAAVVIALISGAVVTAAVLASLLAA